MNKKLPDYFLEKYQMIGSLTFSVIFAIIFLNIFIPASGMSWFQFGSSRLFLFTAAFIVFSLTLLAVSRIVMYQSKRWFQMTYLVYVLWCLAEVIIVCLIYTVLTIFVLGPDEVDPAKLFWSAMIYGSVSLIIPYTISGMYMTIMDKNKTIQKLTARSATPVKSRQGSGGDVRISLFDIGGSLKLSVRSSNLYYIESDDNYIKVWFIDSKNVLQTRMIRCRLKTVEDNFKDTSLIRCNRKYVVNADKVKVLSKEPEGYYLDLGHVDIPPIAVTKTYQASVLSKFSEK